MKPIELREYQNEAVSKVWEEFFSFPDALLVLPTGAGKTHCMLGLCEKTLAARSDLKILMLMNRVTLIENTIKRAGEHFSPELVGEFCGTRGNYDLSRPITVGSIHSLRLKDAPFVNLLIVDEAHRLKPDEPFIKALRAQNPNMKLLGVTATPYRASGPIYGQPDSLFRNVTYSKDLIWAINEGILVKPHMKHTPAAFSTKGIRTVLGDFDQKQLGLLVNNPGKVSEQIKDALPKLEGRKKVIWACVNIAHAELVRSTLNEDAVLVHSKMSMEEREQAIRDFESGDARHLVFVSIVSEGWDCLDSKTEVLTPNGWKFHYEMDGQALVHSINPKTRDLEIVPVQRCFERELRADEHFVCIKSQHMDIRVTDKHNFAFAKKYGKAQVLNEGVELSPNLPSRPTFFTTGNATQTTGLGWSREKAWLLGLLWTDGWQGPNNTVLYQCKPRIVLKIRDALKSVGIDYTESQRSTAKASFKANYPMLYCFAIPKGTGLGANRRDGHVTFYGDLFCKIPKPEHLKMNREEFMAFWEGIIDGNGSVAKNAKKAPCATMAKKDQVDFIMQKAAEIGMSSMYGERTTKNGVKIYVLRVREQNKIDLALSDKRGAKITKEHAPGSIVWCVTNKNGTLVTRRNGKVIVLGNCPKADSAVLMRPTKSAVLYVQTVGRVLRTFPEKKNAIILDYGGVVQACGPLDKPNIPVARGDRKKMITQIPMKFCEQCLEYLPIQARSCPLCGFEFKSDPTKNLSHHAQDGQVLSTQVRPSSFEWISIRSVQIEPYAAKSKKTCLRVTYFPKDWKKMPLREYMSFGDSYSVEKSVRKLHKLNFRTVASEKEAQHVRSTILTAGFSIHVKHGGQYPEILEVKHD